MKIAETKSGIVTKKILKYNKNNEESKINDNNKNELIIRRAERLGRNENIFNNSKKLSFIDNTKNDEKEEDNRNMSIDTIINNRNTISSTKYKYSNIVGKKNNPINNYKMVDINNDNKNNHNLTNHKEHYINYKADRSNISKSIAKSFYLRRNEKNTERNTERNERNNDRNSESNNNKIYSGTKNLNYKNDKKKERKNHNFYESRDNKKNKINNHKNININNYNTYKENNNNKNNHKQNNIYISSLGRKNSGKKNLLYDQEYRHTTKNSNNLQKIEYRHNTTPKNRRHSTYSIKHNKISQSPIKQTDKKDSLFSSFINSKNNDMNFFDTSQSILNNSTMNINQQDYSKSINRRSNNNKKRIKLVNSKALDDINYAYNIRKNYIPNSTSKKENFRNNKN